MADCGLDCTQYTRCVLLLVSQAMYNVRILWLRLHVPINYVWNSYRALLSYSNNQIVGICPGLTRLIFIQLQLQTLERYIKRNACTSLKSLIPTINNIKLLATLIWLKEQHSRFGGRGLVRRSPTSLDLLCTNALPLIVEVCSP